MSNFREIIFSPLTAAGQPSNDDEFPSSSTHSIAGTVAHNTLTEQSAEGSTVFGASFNFVNSIVGAGIIGIPFAIQQCGFLLGVTMLTLVAFMVDRSVVMLIDCGLKVNRFDLEELAEHLLGNAGYFFALTFMFLFAYGGQVAYLVIIGDTVPLVADLLFPGTFLSNRSAVLMLFGVGFILPLCLLRDLSSLAWTSCISIASMVVLIVIILCVAPLASADQERHFTEGDISGLNSSVFAGVGVMSFAFVCQHNSFIVFRSLRERTVAQWNKVAHCSILFSYGLCLSLGLIGFFSFFPQVQGDVMNNLPSQYVSVCVARALLAFTMIFTYPMECVVSTHCLLSLLARWKQRVARGNGSSQVLFHQVNSQDDTQSAASGGGESSRVDDEEEVAVDLHNYTDLERQGGGHVEMTTMWSESGRQVMDEESEADVGAMETVYSLEEEGCVPLPAAAAQSKTVINFCDDGLHSSQGQQYSNNPIHFTEPESRAAESVGGPNNNSDSPAGGASQATPHSYCDQVVVTLILWSTTLLIALMFRELGVVSALTGAIAASMIGYVLPSVIYCKAYEKELRTAVSQADALLWRGDPASMETGKRTFVCAARDACVAVRMVSDLFLPLTMILFGIASLLIGVTTIVFDQNS